MTYQSPLRSIYPRTERRRSSFFADATRFVAEQFALAGRGLAPGVFARGIRFLRHCLGLSAGALEDDEEFEKRGSPGGSRLMLISEHLDAIELQATMKRGGGDEAASSPVDLYRGLLEQALETDQPSVVQVKCIYIILRARMRVHEHQICDVVVSR